MSFQEFSHLGHNEFVPLDVNDDLDVSAVDLLMIVNHLNDSGDSAGFLDTSGDDLVSPVDALLLINHLNEETNLAEGEKPVPTGKGVTTRPIEDFVSQQGTLCIDDGGGGCFLFVPPVENFIGWGDANTLISVDYAGLADEWLEENSEVDLGTSFSGLVMEKTGKDGSTKIKIVLHTKNALTWARPINDEFDFSADPLILGYRAPEVAEGATPALSSSVFKVEMSTSRGKGEELPDLISTFFPGSDYTVDRVQFVSNGSGPLREAFGVEEDMPGRVHVSQVGLDGVSRFVVEKINIFPAGK